MTAPKPHDSASEPRDDTRRPVWLEATESFYRKLNRVASQCGLSRYEALSRGLDALRRERELRNSSLNRNIKSPAQSEVFRRTMGQVSRSYWSKISPEERRERARKSARARWAAHSDRCVGVPSDLSITPVKSSKRAAECGVPLGK